LVTEDDRAGMKNGEKTGNAMANKEFELKIEGAQLIRGNSKSNQIYLGHKKAKHNITIKRMCRQDTTQRLYKTALTSSVKYKLRQQMKTSTTT